MTSATALETLVATTTGSTATTTSTVGTTSPLDNDATAEGTHPVTVLDGILSIAWVFVFNKTVATTLDVAPTYATVLDEQVFQLTGAQVQRQSSHK